MPELSDSQRGITLKAGRLGGILELGEVSLDLELSIQESESDILAPCEDKPRPWRGKVPFPVYLSEVRRGEDIGCSEWSDITPLRAQES